MKRFLVFLIAVCFSANAFAQITKQQDNVNIEQIEDENNPVQNLNKIQNNLDYMMLTWELPQNTSYDEKILSWSDDMLYTISAAGIHEEQEALHYFTSEDVAEYVGWKVKQIAFIPLGTENTHSIVIWEEIDEEKTLVNDLLDRHTGIERGDGILEDHLDLGDQLGLLGDAKVIFVILIQLCQLGGILGGGTLGGVLCLQLSYAGLGIVLIAILVIVLGRGDLGPVLGDDLCKLGPLGRDLLLSISGTGGLDLYDLLIDTLLGFLDGVLVRKRTCGHALALKVNATRGDIVDLDDGTTRGGLTATRLTHKAEDLALVDVKADVVDRLVDEFTGLEILTKIFYLQENFTILLIHITGLLSLSCVRFFRK